MTFFHTSAIVSGTITLTMCAYLGVLEELSYIFRHIFEGHGLNFVKVGHGFGWVGFFESYFRTFSDRIGYNNFPT